MEHRKFEFNYLDFKMEKTKDNKPVLKRYTKNVGLRLYYTIGKNKYGGFYTSVYDSDTHESKFNTDLLEYCCKRTKRYQCTLLSAITSAIIHEENVLGLNTDKTESNIKLVYLENQPTMYDFTLHFQ